MPARDEQTLASLRDQAMRLLDAGCAGVAFPMPGSKQGWLPDATATLIDSVQGHDGLAWLFVTGSIEGAPQSVMHNLAHLGKQLGADAFRLDEAGLSGMPPPENILAFSLALRGARHTYRRMASSHWR
jgi:carbohydrate-selective porin OprB